MIRNIFIGLVVLIAAAVGASFLLPQQAKVSRATVMAATPEQVFTIVNDMSRWNTWAPWAKMDPNMTLEFQGPASGPGAKMAWKSEKLGNGSITITEATSFSQIKQALEFDGSPATSTFTFAPGDGGTKVTWSLEMDTGMNPVQRYFGLLLDSMVGPDYETGLANLKVIAEADAKAANELAQQQAAVQAAPVDAGTSAASLADPDKGPEVVTVEARPIVLMRGSANANDPKAVSEALGAANQKILDYAMKNNLTLGFPPLAITIAHDAAGKWTFDAALPLDTPPATAPAPEGGVKVGETFAGRVVKLTHKGPAATITKAYERIHAYTKENNLKEGTISWEEYVNDPGETSEDELLTNVYVSLKD